MILRQLQYLTALARERHFVRAAKACNVTQPTLSAGIKQLETELGLLLVRRGGRFEGFTSEGERVLEWAMRVEADAESLRQEASAMRGELVGRLRVGAIPVTLPIVPLLVSPFAREHPGVAVTVISQPSVEIQRGLNDGTLDAGVTYLDNEPLDHVRTVPLYRESYYLYTSSAGPLGSALEISWAEAAALPLCLLTTDMQNRRIVNGHFAAAGVTVSPQIETNSVLTIASLLRTGEWSTVLPQVFQFLLGELPGAVAVPLVRPAESHSIGLVVPDREPLTPSARALAALATHLDLYEALVGPPAARPSP